MKRKLLALSIATSLLSCHSVWASGSSNEGSIGSLSTDEVSSLAGERPLFDRNNAAPVNIDPRRSLIVTDQTILSAFSYAKTMQQLADDSGLDAFGNTVTKESLHAQWWDTANRGPSLGLGPHCNDNIGAWGATKLNNFDYRCDRAEGRQNSQNPYNNPSDAGYYIPIALVNRFDVATNPKQGGLDCGEYRIIYARNGGTRNIFDRNLVIFEAVLPNPSVNGSDLSGCKNVQDFWANLSTIDDATQRRDQLAEFYYDGILGYAPVVKAAHYGNATAVAKGQVRTNQFMQIRWLLREFSLQDNNGLKFIPQTVKSNPFGKLFEPHFNHPTKSTFNQDFVKLVDALKSDNVNTYNIASLGDKYNPGDSFAPFLFGHDNYEAAALFNFGLKHEIGEKLDRSDNLNAAHIIARAKSASCAGCHQLSNNQDLGNGVRFPRSLTFVHVSERQTDNGPNGTRFSISPALTDVFLPHRKSIMEAFLKG